MPCELDLQPGCSRGRQHDLLTKRLVFGEEAGVGARLRWGGYVGQVLGVAFAGVGSAWYPHGNHVVLPVVLVVCEVGIECGVS